MDLGLAGSQTVQRKCQVDLVPGRRTTASGFQEIEEPIAKTLARRARQTLLRPSPADEVDEADDGTLIRPVQSGVSMVHIQFGNHGIRRFDVQCLLGIQDEIPAIPQLAPSVRKAIGE